ncbi:MAG: acyltransferase, partial [Methanocellales archaeon]|nr:acyltransferase [Methanocellales archaeon]
MPENVSSKSGRILYIDNIRLFLIVLIVIHHVAVAYGGSGGWPLKEIPTDEISPIIFLLFNAINQSYVLSFFFLLSGYFVPRSYDKKGPKIFLKDRLIRLGIPVLVYTTLITPIIDYIVLNFAEGRESSFFGIVIYRLQHPLYTWEPGPLWFVEALLIFSTAYVFYRLVSSYSFNPFKNNFPTNAAVTGSIIAIALGTFFVRIWYPVGVEVLDHFQLGHFTHYIFCFWAGILAYRGGWFGNLSNPKPWKPVALLSIIALPIMLAVGMSMGYDLDLFLGTFSWQSLVISIWESIACLSIIISLAYIFKKRFYTQGRLIKWMSPNFYAVYILHSLVIVSIMIPF